MRGEHDVVHFHQRTVVRQRLELEHIQRGARDHGAACALLLDSYVEGSHGGTGTTFPWSAIPAGISHPLVLAGGLDESNVAEAIRMARPSPPFWPPPPRMGR
mgnify:CR=1 FL=1